MTTQSKAPKALKPVRKTKAATVSRMLSREKGATLDEIGKSTGWQPHTCRAFLTGLRKKGSNIVREERADGTTAYRIIATPADIVADREGERVMSLTEQLANLKTMSPAQLRAAWREQWRKPAPDIGPDLMRLGIAWRIQARVHGGLPTATRKAIEQALARLERTGRWPARTGSCSRPARGWFGNGTAGPTMCSCYEDGFEHEGTRYESLSQVARAITGTHWSGPAFFGLRKRKPVNRNG